MEIKAPNAGSVLGVFLAAVLARWGWELGGLLWRLVVR